MHIVLASKSPRRQALLQLIVANFDCPPADIDESVSDNELPADYVVRVAQEKALACQAEGSVIIAADTTVVIGDDILVKPVDRDDARQMLTRLSGQVHEVLTAITIRRNKVLMSRLVTTAVTFDILSDELIDAYLETDEPWDKAGSYAVQGYGGSFVSCINGSYSAVVGLPLRETRQLLLSFGVVPTWNGNTNG